MGAPPAEVLTEVDAESLGPLVEGDIAAGGTLGPLDVTEAPDKLAAKGVPLVDEG